MSQHMRMDMERQPCPFAVLCDEIIDGLARHRPTLAQEQIFGAVIGVLIAYAQLRAQGPQLVALNRLLRRQAALFPAHIEAPGFQIDIVETKINEL